MKLLLKTTILEWKINMRNFPNVFFSLILPVMMMLLFGAMNGNKPIDFFHGVGFIDFSTPAYLCMVIAVTGIMTLPITLSQYRERKILKRYMATPIKSIDILISQLIVNGIVTLIGTVLLIGVGIIVFNLKFYGNVFLVMFAMLLVTLSVFSMGLFIAGVTKNAKTAVTVSYVIYFPMLFLSGASIPLAALPDLIVKISRFLPLTYGVELMQGMWMGKPLFDYGSQIAILAGIFVVISALALKAFKWV